MDSTDSPVTNAPTARPSLNGDAAPDSGRPAAKKLERVAAELEERLLSIGINGASRFKFKSARAVAEEHLAAAGDVESAIRRLVRTHVRLAARTGFVTGLGGFATIAVTLPAGFMGLRMVSTRMTTAIAHLRGYDIDSEEVQSVILNCQLGAAGAELLKQAAFEKAGVKVGEQVAFRALRKSAVIRLTRSMGAKTVPKAVPFIGGPVGAAFDGVSCRAIATYAKKAFPPQVR